MIQLAVPVPDSGIDRCSASEWEIMRSKNREKFIIVTRKGLDMTATTLA